MYITIRHTTEDDIPTLVTMWQAIDAFPEGTRPFGGDSADKHKHAQELIKHSLTSTNACSLVAEKTNHGLIATISGHIFDKPAVVLPKVGVIYSLWVDETYRQQGVGTELLDRLERVLASMGAQSFQVGWDFNNTLAASWWQAKGYLPYEAIASKNV